MVRLTSSFVLSLFLIFSSQIFGAQTGTTSGATATCNFDPNKQLVVEYQRASVNVKKPVFGHEIPYGKEWAPGGKPMTLFVNQGGVQIGGKNLSMRGYTMFLFPEQKKWTLVVSKSTDTSGKYDPSQDIVRDSEPLEDLNQPEGEFSIYFAHVAPDQCNMRVDLDNYRAVYTFKQTP